MKFIKKEKTLKSWLKPMKRLNKTKPLKTKAVAKAIVLVFALLAASTAIFHHFYVINLTESWPLGVYKKTKPTFQSGEMVLFCPPENEATGIAYERQYLKGGLCENGYGYMIKKIAGAPGDFVTVGKSGVFVNGQKIDKSQPREKDGLGRPMPSLTMDEYKLAEHEFFVVSDYNEKSFDSRYMGFIDKRSIKAGLLPVWIEF